MSRLPRHIVQKDEVELAVPVVIAPGSAGRPTRAMIPVADAGLIRNIGEVAVAVVMEQMVAATGRDVDIGESVIVVIAHGSPNGESQVYAAQSAGIGDVGRAPVLVEFPVPRESPSPNRVSTVTWTGALVMAPPAFRRAVRPQPARSGSRWRC